MRLASTLFIITLASSSGCAHMSQSQKRTASFFTGMAVGGAIGSLAASQKKKENPDQGATVLGYGLLGATGGHFAGEYFFSDETKIKDLSDKLDVHEDFVRNQNPQTEPFLDMGSVRLKNKKNEHLGQKNPFECKESNEFLMFCPSSDNPDLLANCKKPTLLYLSDKWAIEFRAWYSDAGCWSEREFGVLPELLEYLNKSYVNTYLDFQKKVSK